MNSDASWAGRSQTVALQICVVADKNKAFAVQLDRHNNLMHGKVFVCVSEWRD